MTTSDVGRLMMAFPASPLAASSLCAVLSSKRSSVLLPETSFALLELALLELAWLESALLESTMDWTASLVSTRKFSVLRKRKPVQTRERMIPALPKHNRNLRPFRSTRTTPPIVITKLTSVKATYPQCACRSERPLCRRILVLYPIIELTPVA